MSVSYCHAPRQIRHISTVALNSFFKNHKVFHQKSPFQLGLFEHTLKCGGRQLYTPFACNGHSTCFGGVMELTVTAFLSNQIPSIFSEDSK